MSQIVLAVNCNLDYFHILKRMIAMMIALLQSLIYMGTFDMHSIEYVACFKFWVFDYVLICLRQIEIFMKMSKLTPNLS